MSASERLCRNHHAAEKHTRTPDSSDTYGVVSTRTAPSSRSGSTSFGEAMNKPHYTERYRDRAGIFFKTCYETRRIGENEENELQILKSMRNDLSYFGEADFINAYRDQMESQSMRNFLSWLEEAKAIASVKW